MTDSTAKSENANVVDLKAAKTNKKSGAKCPICAKQTSPDYRPFCSKRCADVDLGKWLGDGYRIPTEEVPGMDDNFDGDA